MKARYTPPILVLVFVFLAVGIIAAGGISFSSQQDSCVIDTSDVVSNARATAGTPSANTLRVAIAAMISPDKARQHYAELLNLVGQHVGRSVDITQKKTYAEVNEMLERNMLDLAFVCSGPYVLAKRKFGMEILVVPVAYGEKVYYSYIIVGATGKLATFDDLRGKTFAFTDPTSNTGCLVPRYMLGLRGETPETFFKSTSHTYSHDNSIRAVAENVADGAAVDSLIWEYLNATDPADTSRTRIIEKSPPYGIPPVVVNPSLDLRLKSELKGIFLNLHKDAQAAALLKEMGIDRFEEGDDAMYDSVRAMQDWLGHQPAVRPTKVNRRPQ